MAVLKNQRRRANKQSQVEQQQTQQANKTNTLQPPTAAAAAASKAGDPSSIQQRSAPSSPLQKASSIQLPVVESAASSSQPSTADVESTPVYTAEEQKMLATLATVTSRISLLEFELPALRGQITNHCSRLCLQRMAPAVRTPTLNPTKLHLAHKHLQYSAGMVDENVMQAIFKLDSIQTDNPSIRAQRKATVAKGNAIIAESIKMRAKLTRWDRFLPPKEDELQQTPTTPAAEEAAMMQDEAMVEDEEDKDEQMAEQKYAEPASKQTKQPTKQQQQQPPARSSPLRTAAPAPTPAFTAPAPTPAPVSTPALSPLQRKYAHLNLPQWTGPTFHSRLHPSTGALLIEADVAGVLAEDILVSSDPATRTLTIRGVKLPQRRRSVPHASHGGFFALGRNLPTAASSLAVEPHGFFSKVVDFAELDPSTVLNLAAMSATIDNRKGLLQVTVPRNPPVRRAAAPQQQQQQRFGSRQPVQHSSGASYSDDEEEAAAAPDAYSQFYQQPRAAPRRAPQQWSNGWW